MNIIFGDGVEKLSVNYTLLELDTFSIPAEDKTVTAYCVVEKIPLGEFVMMEHYINLHAELMSAYKKQQWDFCLTAIDDLRGKWAGEVDSYYDILIARINEFKLLPPGQNWTHVVVREESV